MDTSCKIKKQFSQGAGHDPYFAEDDEENNKWRDKAKGASIYPKQVQSHIDTSTKITRWPLETNDEELKHATSQQTMRSFYRKSLRKLQRQLSFLYEYVIA